MPIEIARRIKPSKLFVEAHIADLHFGKIDPLLEFNILKEQFLYNLESMQILDMVVIEGDIFDHKFMANADAVMYACYFIEALVDICRRKGSTLIIIAGTYDHDADQLKLFYPYIGIGKDVDVRIDEEVRFEYVKGKRILCIPELYNKGEEYYNRFLFNGGYYDACYMHGTYKGSIFGKTIADLNSKREPIFKMEYFTNCIGPIISGHVHTPGCFDTHFYYCGTPIRRKFGEEEDKGFIVMLHNIDTREYCINFEPIESFRYDTINLDSMINEDPKRVIEYVKKLQEDGIDNIRVQFTQNNENNLSIIRNYFRTNANVKIDADFKNQETKVNMEKLADKYKGYEYLLDKSSKPQDKLSAYINQKKGYQYISSEELVEFLNSL
jgi:DNA repair exonuclease SbcCD nuclease subunit